mmetsp:Transcript_6497/g.10416  ORF Transcript_6497/g.10416 Transcript_6497/m.10416 type:complete len:705 (-) Transcript_6497:102-2216(-)
MFERNGECQKVENWFHTAAAEARDALATAKQMTVTEAKLSANANQTRQPLLKRPPLDVSWESFLLNDEAASLSDRSPPEPSSSSNRRLRLSPRASLNKPSCKDNKALINAELEVIRIMTALQQDMDRDSGKSCSRSQPRRKVLGPSSPPKKVVPSRIAPHSWSPSGNVSSAQLRSSPDHSPANSPLSLPTPTKSWRREGRKVVSSAPISHVDAVLERRQLQCELGEVQASMEAQMREAQEAKNERDREMKRSEVLESHVEHLQAALQNVVERTQFWEEQFSADRDCSVAVTKDVKPLPELMAEVIGTEDTATGAPSSANSCKTLEEEASTTESDTTVTELLSENSQAGVVDAPHVVENGSDPDSKDMVGSLEELWDFVVQGPLVKEKEQADSEQRFSCFPGNAVECLAERGIAFACCRGHRLDAKVPNQDDFLLAVRAPVEQGQVALYGVFDGHGPTGHRCAAFARSYLPECIFSDPDLFTKPKSVLKRAFAKTQEALLQQPFNVQVSGTTATLTLLIHSYGSEHSSNSVRAYVAHVGDSRAVLVSQKEEDVESFVLTTLTREHRPDDPEEEHRVRSWGGEIRKSSNGAGVGRIFVPGRNHPALPLTRSLGAAASVECGVLSEPEISSHRLRHGSDVLLVLGTDGLFEFCTSGDVAAPLLEHGVSTEILEDICSLSRQRWEANSYNQTVDDMTVIVVSLLTHFG